MRVNELQNYLDKENVQPNIPKTTQVLHLENKNKSVTKALGIYKANAL